MRNQGFTYLEILMAFLILSVTLLGLFEIFNIALNATHRAIQENIAMNLARGLMAEVMSKNFADPASAATATLGPEAGEIGRSTFDDADDYNGYSETPPVSINGTPMVGPDFSQFTRQVRVVYCNISGNNITEVSPGPTDYKKITVTVSSPYVRNISIDELKVK